MANVSVFGIALLGSEFDDDAASITFVYRATQFLIRYRFGDGSTLDLKEYQRASSSLQEPQALKDLLRLLLYPVWPEIESCAEGGDVLEPVALESFLLAEHYIFDVDESGRVSTERTTRTSTFHIQPLPLTTLGEFVDRMTLIPAKDIELVNFDSTRPSLQSEAKLPDGQRIYFKPVEFGRQAEAVREIKTQNQLKERGVTEQYRMSRLVGLATMPLSGDIAGLLFQWIEAQPLLEINVHRRQQQDHRWRAQISSFIQALHAEGLTWGDVNDCNVMIDDADGGGNAWALDFGGKTGTDYALLPFEHLRQNDWDEFSNLFKSANSS